MRKSVLIPMAVLGGLTIGAINASAEGDSAAPVPLTGGAGVTFVRAPRAPIKVGNQGMPTSTSLLPEYEWESLFGISEPNFAIQNQGNNFLTAGSLWDSKPGTPETDIQIGGVTTHHPATQAHPAYTFLSPEATAARGMAYQPSTSATGPHFGYNHDGLAFLDLNKTLDAAALAHAAENNGGYQKRSSPYDTLPDYALPDLTEYRKNIKSGKWHPFVNGERPCAPSRSDSIVLLPFVTARPHAKITSMGYIADSVVLDNAFPRADTSEYQKNIKSGKWHPFVNGEGPEGYRCVKAFKGTFANGDD